MAILSSVALATFITALDNTVVNVALPVMQRQLHLSTNDLEWIASSYILTFASLMLAGGKLADKYGRRRIFLCGLALFGASSVLAGLAPNATLLILARAVQGAGGALVLPATLAILASDVTARERHLGAGLATAAAASALALGPLVGGVITEYWHWSWIFYLNVPVVALTLVIAAWGVPDTAPSRPGQRLDAAGLTCSGLSLCALTWALIEGNTRGWTSQPILLAFGAALLCAALFVLVEHRSEQPMLDVALFANRVFTGATIAQFLWGLGINGVFFFTSLFLQNILRFSPMRAGAAFIPLAVVLVVVVPFVDRLVALLGADVVVCAGLVLVAAGLFLASRLGVHGGFLDLLPALLFIGAGSALSIPLTSAALAVVPEASAGTASAVLTAAKEVAGVFGIALTGAILLARQNSLLHSGSLPADAFAAGYHRGLLLGGALTVAGAVIALRTMRRPARHRRELVGAHR